MSHQVIGVTSGLFDEAEFPVKIGDKIYNLKTNKIVTVVNGVMIWHRKDDHRPTWSRLFVSECLQSNPMIKDYIDFCKTDKYAGKWMANPSSTDPFYSFNFCHLVSAGDKCQWTLLENWTTVLGDYLDLTPEQISIRLTIRKLWERQHYVKQKRIAA